MSRPTIWIVGSWHEAIFADAAACMHSHAACHCFECSVAAIKSSSFDRSFPSAIILLQARPGQFASDDVERLHAHQPLARLIVLTGPWCEGELRSGHRLPGITRVPWRSWQNRLSLELTISDNVAAIPLPRTATETERIESIISAIKRASPLRGTVAICSRLEASFGLLADAAASLGLTPVRHAISDTPQDLPPTDVTIFDGWEIGSAFARAKAPPNGKTLSSRLLTLHFPRPEDHDLAQQAGFAGVLAYPLLLSELAAAVGPLLKKVA